MYPSTDYPKQYVSSSPPPTAPPPPQFSYDPPAIGLPHVTPGATNPPINNNIAWSTGLCDCCDDAGNCCLTCWCPCITFGKVAEIVDQGSSSCGTSGALYALLSYFTGCACCLSCVYRTKLRKQYQLEESPCGDCLVHCFCEQCSLCQEYRELKNRGFDMSIGWNANVQRQSQGVVPPVVQHGMSR